MHKIKKLLIKNLYYIAWVQALVASLGSLIFSEILHFPPCVLCWYQRIFMYPIVFILGVGILNKDKKVYQYVIPLGVIGLVISLYHNLLYYQVIPENITPCIAGISCTTKFIEWFGFVTIPFLSSCAFAVIIACMWYARKNK